MDMSYTLKYFHDFEMPIPISCIFFRYIHFYLGFTFSFLFSFFLREKLLKYNSYTLDKNAIEEYKLLTSSSISSDRIFQSHEQELELIA